ncbi:MAG: HAD hydrolase family protein, partial [Selenomonas sp.]|nr:HAD hydrolase family protein [Selenomonas sp.]
SAKYIRCRIVDNSYLFLYCDEEADVKSIVEHCREQTNLIVEGVGRKIYFFPPGMDKGWALLQLKEHLGDKYAFAAGDSPIDESMLKLADEAIAEYGLHVELEGVCWHQPLETVYSEWLLKKVLERLSEKE